jgi:hypothetical protein
MAKRIYYKGSLDGSAPVYRYFPVNDNQTIYKGDIVVLNTNKVTLAADNPDAGTVLGVSNTDIVTTTAAATDLIAVDINPNSIYSMAYSGNATPSIDAAYDLATPGNVFDADDTDNGFIIVVGNVNKPTGRADVILSNRAFPRTTE